MKNRRSFRAGIAGWTLGVALLVLSGCAQQKEAEESYRLASTVGKNAVRLTDDVESVQGRCSFVRHIVPDDPVYGPPTDAALPDYFKIAAVLAGADTVLVSGRTGEAYICGPGPLNPDGTRKVVDPPPR